MLYKCTHCVQANKLCFAYPKRFLAQELSIRCIFTIQSFSFPAQELCSTACAKNRFNRACSVHARHYSLEIWWGNSRFPLFTFYGAISLEKWYSNEKWYSQPRVFYIATRFLKYVHTFSMLFSLVHVEVKLMH